MAIPLGFYYEIASKTPSALIIENNKFPNELWKKNTKKLLNEFPNDSLYMFY